MTTLDWIIVAVVVLGAVAGALRGFLAGALSLAGFLGGAALGARLGARILPDGQASPYAPAVALACALIAGGVLATLMETLGERLRAALPIPGVGAVDGALGALLGGAAMLALLWIAGAAALQTPGAADLRREVQRSEVLSRLNDVLPPSGGILRALARFDPLPTITGPSPDRIEAPDRALLAQPQVRAARASTVRILTEACGLGVEGSGWIARAGLVVTNAHVVAGAGDLEVHAGGDGPGLAARVVLFDPGDDVAVLAVPGLGGPRLRLAPGDPGPAAGTSGVILGYPGNGPFDARAARLGATRGVLTQDAYGRGPVLRSITSFRGRVRHGNSGGPIVDRAGRVLATVFASAENGRVHGGFGVRNGVVRRALARTSSAARAVSTGACAA